MAEGFLGRWSQRKRALAQGVAVSEPTAPPRDALTDAHQGVPLPAPSSAATPPRVAALTGAPPPPPVHTPAPALTLEDAQALTPQSDFRPFVAAQVSSQVKNAAMKKLFADPHFNVMDRLDTYIDDYSQSDLLPEAMLRRMASAQFMGLVETPAEAAATASRECIKVEPDSLESAVKSSEHAPDSIANEASEAGHAAPVLPPQPSLPLPTAAPDPDHAHLDMRLQPHHAAGPQEPGDRAG